MYPSIITAKVLELFTNLTKKSAQVLISDLITERLNTALNKEKAVSAAQEPIPVVPEENESKIETTEEEMEAYMIIKSILRQVVDVKRVTYKDTQSYFTILLDNNIRRIICRLYLNGSKKYFVTLDENRKEIKVEIDSLDRLFEFAPKLFEVVEAIEGKNLKV